MLGGDSAGAASVSLHLVAYGGRDDGLFHAAAAESVSYATVYTVAESQWQYDNLAIRLGCVGSSTIACLRNKTAVEIQDVNYNIPFPGAAAPPLYMYNPVIDGDLLQDLTYTAYQKGNFIKMPVIIVSNWFSIPQALAMVVVMGKDLLGFAALIVNVGG